MKSFYYNLRISHGTYIGSDYTDISGYVVANTELEAIGLLLEGYPDSNKDDFEIIEIEPDIDFGVSEQLRDRVYQGWRD